MDHFLVRLLAFRKDLSFLLSYLVSTFKTYTRILLVGVSSMLMMGLSGQQGKIFLSSRKQQKKT